MDGAVDNIEDRRQALVRILAGLVVMVGMVPHTGVRVEREPRRTLTRALRNAVLRLLRPAEAAARRLAIALAAGLTVTFDVRPRAPRKPLRKRRQYMPVMPPPPGATRERSYPKSLPLLDTPRREPGLRRMRTRSVPHIGFGDRPRIPAPPSPRDLLDATGLCCRLEALNAALADLPKQALRFARWQARQAFLRAIDRTSRAALRRPLRWGRPPGMLRRLGHEVHEVLDFSHQLALESLRKPDTS